MTERWPLHLRIPRRSTNAAINTHTGMGDRLRMGKPSLYVTSHLG